MVHIKSLAKTTGNVTLTGLPTPATGDYISGYVGNGLTIVGYVEWNNYKWIYYSGEVSFGSFMYIAQ